MNRPAAVIIAVIGFLGIAFYVFVVSEAGILNHSRVRARLAAMEREIAVLTNENARLARDIERLQKDSAYVKALAKTYGFRETSRERIVVFIDEKIRTNAAHASRLSDELRDSTRPSYFVLIVFAVLTVLLYLIIRAVSRRKR